MYLLDTNICIALLNENPQAVTKFNHFFSQCYLSMIVVSELYKGVIRPSQNNRSMIIQNLAIRERVKQITVELIGGHEPEFK